MRGMGMELRCGSERASPCLVRQAGRQTEENRRAKRSPAKQDTTRQGSDQEQDRQARQGQDQDRQDKRTRGLVRPWQDKAKTKTGKTNENKRIDETLARQGADQEQGQARQGQNQDRQDKREQED